MQQRNLRRLILALASSAICFNALAVAPGLYMGLMMGPATNNGSQQKIQVYPLPSAASPKANTAIASPKSSQFGSRIFAGYKFNQYAGFEGGFSYFSGIKYVANSANVTPVGGTSVRVRGIDFVGKLDYSYNNTIGVFGKLGVAALYETTPGTLNITNYHTIPTPKAPVSTKAITTGSNTYLSKLSPTFTFGVSYGLDQNWQLDASATRLMPGGAISTVDFYALGLSYHFVDTYTGQFLSG